MRSLRLLTRVLVGAAVMLAGCGNGEPKAVFDKDAVLRIELGEYSIEPQVITVQAVTSPTIVRLVATNVGHLTHNLHVESMGDGPEGSGGQDQDFGGTATAQPGQTMHSGYLFLLPGRYRLTCTISNHDNLGQHGTLIVLPPKTP